MASLSEIRTQARQRADMVGSDFISDSEFNTMINSSAAALYDLLSDAFEDYFTKDSAPLSLGVGQNRLTLPNDFFKLRGVDLDIGNGEYFTLSSFNFNERNIINKAYRYGLYGNRNLKYCVMGNQLIIEPKDTAASNNFVVWYVPTYANLVNDNDLLPFSFNKWEEFIVLDVAIKALTKEESDTSKLEVEKERIIKRLNTAAKNRDSAQPKRVSDKYMQNLYFPDNRFY